MHIAGSDRGKLILVQQDCSMAQAIRHQPLAAEMRIQSQISPYRICGGCSWTIIDSSPSTSVFPCLHHYSSAPYSFIHLSWTL